ncbi:hypothetical protein Ciccas_004037 [Cichlidogyrus casuarinus]|uniref:Uncharacterized protein n=1 Tax=Cichlidogyrus casuarinus TaxID=1844966 RepID=A0ABD2QEY2_9PLAT
MADLDASSKTEPFIAKPDRTAKWRKHRNLKLWVSSIVHVLLHLFLLSIGCIFVIVSRFFLNRVDNFDNAKMHVQEFLRNSDPEMPNVMVKNGAYVLIYVMNYGLAKTMLIYGVALLILALLGCIVQIVRKRLILKIFICLTAVLFLVQLILLIWVVSDPVYFRSLFEIPIKNALGAIASSITFDSIFETTRFAFGSDTYCCRKFFPNKKDCIPGVASCMELMKDYQKQYTIVYIIPALFFTIILCLDMMLNIFIFLTMNRKHRSIPASPNPT